MDMGWFGLFLGWIPLSGWVVICGVIAAPLLYFGGPILLPIWRMLPAPVRVFLAGALAVFLAWAGGRYVGAKRERDEQASARDTSAPRHHGDPPDSRSETLRGPTLDPARAECQRAKDCAGLTAL